MKKERDEQHDRNVQTNNRKTDDKHDMIEMYRKTDDKHQVIEMYRQTTERQTINTK